MISETSTNMEPAAVLSAALDLQRRAYLAHPYPSHSQRRSDLRTLLRLISENKDAMTDAVSVDYGHRSRHETMLTEISPLLASIRHAIRHLGRWMRAEHRHVDRLNYGLAGNRVLPQPLGVVGVIVPWNFPINLTFVPLTSIFAAGNRAMVKMSENSHQLTRLLIELLPNYFPPEKLQIFEETGGVGVAFSKLPFDHLLFTGSGETGKAVMAAAAANLCPVTLELGGKSPAIVCEDFDLRLAARRLLFVKYLNAGQICTTVDYAFVPAARVAEFVALAREIVSHRYPSLDSPDYTSIIDARAYQRLVNALAEARTGGAEVVPLLPGEAFDPEHRRIAPHIVVGAPSDSQLMQREIFGPILPVVPYRQLDEVIAYVNARPRPLAIYPFSRNRAVIDHIVEHVMSGGVTVNDALMHVGQDDLPFGGIGASGMGHYHGREGFITFSKLRPIFRQARWSSLALLTPPYGRFANAMIAYFTR
jgi:coniferyl-aldehyde dehydrogenase